MKNEPPVTAKLSGASEGISRRTVAKGMAWSVPVIAVSVATPLAAASVATDFSTTLISLTAAPQAGTGTGDQGTQALLATNSTFNTVGVVRNDGPAAATELRAQVTFDEVANPNEFTVNAPWVITSVGENTDLNRWLVNLSYAGTVPAGDTAQFVVTTRTRLDAAFPPGQSGAYQVLGRAYDSTGAITNDLSDYFYVLR